MSRPVRIQQECQYYSGVIGKNRDQALHAEPKDAILQGLYREKSCPGPFVYSKSVNISGFMGKSRDPAL